MAIRQRYFWLLPPSCHHLAATLKTSQALKWFPLGQSTTEDPRTQTAHMLTLNPTPRTRPRGLGRSRPSMRAGPAQVSDRWKYRAPALHPSAAGDSLCTPSGVLLPATSSTRASGLQTPANPSARRPGTSLFLDMTLFSI